MPVWPFSRTDLKKISLGRGRRSGRYGSHDMNEESAIAAQETSLRLLGLQTRPKSATDAAKRKERVGRPTGGSTPRRSGSRRRASTSRTRAKKKNREPPADFDLLWGVTTKPKKTTKSQPKEERKKPVEERGQPMEEPHSSAVRNRPGSVGRTSSTARKKDRTAANGAMKTLENPKKSTTRPVGHNLFDMPLPKPLNDGRSQSLTTKPKKKTADPGRQSSLTTRRHNPTAIRKEVDLYHEFQHQDSVKENRRPQNAEEKRRSDQIERMKPTAKRDRDPRSFPWETPPGLSRRSSEKGNVPTIRKQPSLTEKLLSRESTTKKIREEFDKKESDRASSIPGRRSIERRYSVEDFSSDRRSFFGSLSLKSRPTSKSSLPGIFQGGTLDDTHALKINTFDAFTPRPTLRYPKYEGISNRSSRAASRSSRNLLADGWQAPPTIKEETARAPLRTVGELADELDSSGIRELMDRERKRKERKQREADERLQRKLAKGESSRGRTSQRKGRSKSESGYPSSSAKDVFGDGADGLVTSPHGAAVLKRRLRDLEQSHVDSEAEPTRIVKSPSRAGISWLDDPSMESLASFHAHEEDEEITPTGPKAETTLLSPSEPSPLPPPSKPLPELPVGATQGGILATTLHLGSDAEDSYEASQHRSSTSYPAVLQSPETADLSSPDLEPPEADYKERLRELTPSPNSMRSRSRFKEHLSDVNIATSLGVPGIRTDNEHAQTESNLNSPSGPPPDKTIPNSKSLASIDSEGSWFARKAGFAFAAARKRISGVPTSNQSDGGGVSRSVSAASGSWIGGGSVVGGNLTDTDGEDKELPALPVLGTGHRSPTPDLKDRLKTPRRFDE